MAVLDWVQYKDENNVTQTKWDDKVTDDASAKANYGLNARYVGKEGTLTSNQNGIQNWKLNSDGSRTELTSESKPSTTISDAENSEPESPNVKTAAAVGIAAGLGESIADLGKDAAKSAFRNSELGTEVSEQLKGLTQQAGGLTTTLKVVGKAAGVVSAYNAWNEAVEKGGVGRYAKAGVETAILFIKTNPLVGVAIALSDLTGLSDALFKNW
jgi:hypothetical protein